MIPICRAASVSVLALSLVACAAPRRLVTTPSSASRSAIAVVDMQRAILESIAGVAAQAALKQHFDDVQESLAKRQAALAHQRAEIDRDKSSAHDRRMAEWAKAQTDLQTETASDQQEIETRQKSMLVPITSGANDAVRLVASEGGYSLVLDRAPVAYAGGATDITERVVAEMDRRARSEAALSAAGAHVIEPPHRAEFDLPTTRGKP